MAVFPALFQAPKKKAFLPATTVLAGLMLAPLSAQEAWAKPYHEMKSRPLAQSRFYSVGEPLPRGVSYQPVPAHIMVRLGAPPKNHVYGMVDGSVLQISLATKRVVQAIASC